MGPVSYTHLDVYKRQVYVYDNNSSDGTGEIAREHGAVVRSERRQGKGNVVRQMMRDIDADYYLCLLYTSIDSDR